MSLPPRVIYDEIVVQSPPPGIVFSSYGPVQDTDPISFQDALARPDADLWWNAMTAEIKAVIQNKTWVLVELPSGKRAIPLKWVFKIKRDAQGKLDKYKARIVVKGYSQVAGLDFEETFAPVIRIESVRVIFAIAAANGLYILQVDCKNAFLHGESDVILYVTQPEGFVDLRFKELVLLLNKSLYGLKQAPRIWYLFLCNIVLDLKFISLETDSCIYKRGDIILGVYVDDIKIVGPSKEACDAVFKELAQHVKAEYKGPIKSFLGINVIRNWDQHLIAINQGVYIDTLVNNFGLSTAKTTNTPLDKTLPLLYASSQDKMCNAKYYQRVTGSLNHLAVYSRPDIAFAVSKLSQFNSQPTALHLNAALHVIRCLKGTRNLCLVYKRQEEKEIIKGYSDADWGSDSNDRKSYTGYIFMIHGGPVTWTSHKQTTIAHSTMEAEYMALSDAAREAISRAQFFQEFNLLVSPVRILTDSQTALDVASGTAINYRKVKHIDIRYHAIRHSIHEDKIVVEYIPTEYQTADICTKALGPQLHHRLIGLMGMRNSYQLL